jgi:hypothetical protein
MECLIGVRCRLREELERVPNVGQARFDVFEHRVRLCVAVLLDAALGMDDGSFDRVRCGAHVHECDGEDFKLGIRRGGHVGTVARLTGAFISTSRPSIRWLSRGLPET